MEVPKPSAEGLPAGDVQAPDDPTAPAIYQSSIPVFAAQEDLNEVMIRVKGSTLRRVRTNLSELKTQKVDWSDLFLALFTLAGGVWITSLISTPVAGISTFVFGAAPLITVGSMVAFLFQRRNESRAAAQIATNALEELPDPDTVSD